MLAARGQTKSLGRIRGEPEDRLGQPLGVDQFARMGDASHLFEKRVAGIFLVEAAQRGLEPLRVPGLKYLSHYLGLIAEVRYGGKQG
jgi:hypothetical protein